MNSLRVALNIFLTVGFIAGFVVPCKGQPADLKLDHISPEQGLSQSTIYAIVQDSQGFMWFGTQDGLNRYDGYSITVFKHDALDSNSIADNSIWSLLSQTTRAMQLPAASISIGWQPRQLSAARNSLRYGRCFC